MNYPEIGQTVEIHSYKHNSKIHRIWHETTILDISDDKTGFIESCLWGTYGQGTSIERSGQ